MAFTLDEYNALKSAIGAGVRSVTHGGTTVTYHSLEDMMRALALMEADLITAGTITKNGTQRIRFVGNNGLGW